MDDDLDKPVPELVDDTLAVLAERVSALEAFRKASSNQHGSLTRGREPDKDGKHRGYGLPVDHPAVIQSQDVITWIRAIEDDTVKLLEKYFRATPLGPWVFAQKGLGYKTVARLLACIGDPYWHGREGRPRQLSELWSFCGYGDAAAQKLRKGHKANWSPEAKMRTYLIAEGTVKILRKPCHSVKDDKGLVVETVHVEDCVCSPYRLLFDEMKARYAGSAHTLPCTGCTPKGALAAPIGSPRSGAHIQAIAVRAVSKQILADLWREAKRLHSDLPGGQAMRDTQSSAAAGEPNLSDEEAA